MTDAIKRLRALHEAATGGEWSVVADDRDGAVVRSASGGLHGRACDVLFDPTLPAGDADLALIAAMRNALPVLLDVVEAAREACGVCALEPRVGCPCYDCVLVRALARLDGES